MGFAERLRSLREARDLTQDDIAKGLDVSRPTVSSWESGKISPRLQRLDKLAALLGTTPYYLMNGDGPERVESRAASAAVPMRTIGVTCMGDGDEQEADSVVEVPKGVAERHPGLFVVHGMDRKLTAEIGGDMYAEPYDESRLAGRIELLTASYSPIGELVGLYGRYDGRLWSPCEWAHTPTVDATTDLR